MKTLITIIISMISAIFYAQSSNEIELANRINNLVTNNIPDLAGKDYFILDASETDKFIISKIANNYTYYKLHINRGSGIEITKKGINSRPILDKIFTDFTPVYMAKKYLSEYGYDVFKEYMIGIQYFAIYKNGVKTFDTCLPSSLDNNRIESPIDVETLSFLYTYLVAFPDRL